MSNYDFSKRSDVRAATAACFAELERVYSPLAGWGRDYVQRAYDAALAGEKQHMAFGARLVGRVTPRQPHSVRAKYFACKWALERTIGEHVTRAPFNWAEVMGTRDDAQWAFAAADELWFHADRKYRAAIRGWASRWAPVFAELDYSKHYSDSKGA